MNCKKAFQVLLLCTSPSKPNFNFDLATFPNSHSHLSFKDFICFIKSNFHAPFYFFLPTTSLYHFPIHSFYVFWPLFWIDIVLQRTTPSWFLIFWWSLTTSLASPEPSDLLFSTLWLILGSCSSKGYDSITYSPKVSIVDEVCFSFKF